jgi:hypothetical protein
MGIVWFFFGMVNFQGLSQRYDQYTAESWNLVCLATIVFFVGWISGSLVYRGRTPRARVLLLLVTFGSWILLMAGMAIIFGVDTSAILQSPGVDLGIRLFPLIFAAYFLGSSRLVDNTPDEKTS